MDWQIVALTRPFNLVHTGIEYCAGLVESHDGSKIIFTVGVEDGEAHIAAVNRDVIDKNLFPINHLLININM